ncbi:MAG: histidine kinase [Chitinophagaceae bacterium]|nr:histidine kinase [Chitinophagaceae bacterium]
MTFWRFGVIWCIWMLTISVSGMATPCPELERDNWKHIRQEPNFEKLLHQYSDAFCRARIYEWHIERTLDLNLPSTMDTLQKWAHLADSLYLQAKAAPNQKINLFLHQALIHHHLGMYDSCLAICFKQLDVVRNINNAYYQAHFLLTISSCFNRMGQSDKGIEYARQALPVVQQLTDSLDRAYLIHQLAARYLWRYQDTKIKTLLDSTTYFTEQLLGFGRALNDSVLLTRGYNRMNGISHERGLYLQALKYIDSAQMFRNSRTDDRMLALGYGDRADILMELKRYPEALKQADTFLQFQLRGGNPEQIANAYALIYQIHSNTKNYKDALNALEGYHDAMDSLRKNERSKSINDLELKYNKARNENAIRELAQEKRIYLLMLIAGLLGITAGIFYWRQSALKSKHRIFQAEQRLNRARMNPHFFFNTLASLQTMALQKQDHFVLASSLSRFAHIMRETLESTYKEYITLEEEMEFLEEYLSLQSVRFPATFSYSVTCDETLDPERWVIPSMILQPFVENSLEHGFDALNKEGQIHIRFEKKNQELHVEICDNGRGIQATSKKRNGQHISRATQIIRDRLFIFNQRHRQEAHFQLSDAEGGGTRVEIVLPLIQQQDIQEVVPSNPQSTP